MRYVYSREEMQDLDRWAIEEFGLPGRLLMENAGRSCALMIRNLQDVDNFSSVMVLCGGGNNGGDGLVIARYLHQWGYRVLIIHHEDAKNSELNRINLTLCKKLGIAYLDKSDPQTLEHTKLHGYQYSCVVDALYGTGFKGNLKAEDLELIKAVNSLPAQRIAIDIPSGLDANNGLGNGTIDADYTLALQALVRGNLFGDGLDLCGKTFTIDIGIPEDAYRLESPLVLQESEDLPQMNRPRNSHKSNYGRLVILGGSSGMTGAPILSSRAALRAGAGYVQLFHDPADSYAYAALPVEVMSRSLEWGGMGMEAFKDATSKATAVLAGPGMGKSASAKALVEHLIANCGLPLILDADALNIISENPLLLHQMKGKPILLTPHWGEFCRLAGISMENLRQDPFGCLRSFVDRYQVRLILKSHFSIVADWEFNYLITSGNSGLATGGSGDALAGVIASFVAQGFQLVDAARTAAYIFGKTAERLGEERALHSITPSDVIESLFLIKQETTQGG